MEKKYMDEGCRRKIILSNDEFQKLKKDTEMLLKRDVGKIFQNKNGERSARLYQKGAKRIVSREAINKSIDTKIHFEAAKNIGELFEKSKKTQTSMDRAEENDIKYIHRYETDFEYDNFSYPIKITVKEYYDETEIDRIYSIEVIKKGDHGYAPE
jgi:hypothetical protein